MNLSTGALKTALKNAQTVLEQSNSLNKVIRDFFSKENFLEVQTPILTPIPGMEPHLTPFETRLTLPPHLKSKSDKAIPFYLNHSPELQMKKLLAMGLRRIFNLTKVFRNGELGGPLHNPEFTMLEWYRQKATYFDIMNDCEKLIIKAAKALKAKHLDLKSPWPRKSVNELFIENLEINLLENKNLSVFKKTATDKNLDIKGCNDWDDIFFKLFLNHIEPNLPKNKAIFIYDYPSSQAALSRKKKSEPFFAERFELYINAVEIANCFTELTDEKEQRSRLIDEQKLRKKLKKPIFDIDEEFLKSLNHITNPSAGIALGIDRLLMILLNKSSIEEVLIFPVSKMLKI